MVMRNEWRNERIKSTNASHSGTQALLLVIMSLLVYHKFYMWLHTPAPPARKVKMSTLATFLLHYWDTPQIILCSLKNETTLFSDSGCWFLYTNTTGAKEWVNVCMHGPLQCLHISSWIYFCHKAVNEDDNGDAYERINDLFRKISVICFTERAK